MVDLFALLQDLGERIAAKGEASTSTQLDEDDPVESRFRTVLPTLLEAYFVPDKVKERELIAILKLLCHTIKHFPGVLFHGKGHAVLPIMGKIIPLFAEPAASGCHEGLFETLGALTTLLSAGDPVIFRQIFIGATLVIEDIVSVASFFATPSDFHSCTTISLYCFKEAYSQIQVIDKESSVVPSCWEAPKGPGLAIDISGEVRWKNLADAVTKLIARCLLEDALHVEGLITPSFVSAVGKLLIYGDTNLHKSIFDLLQIMAATADRDAVPSENIIMLVLEILSGSENRTAAYDSILGACLLSLFSLGKPGVIESTAHAFFEVLPSAIRNTSSRQLKVALCNVFLIIVKHYPPYLKHICSLLEFVFCPELAPSLTTCIQLALEEFGLEGVTGGLMNGNCLTTKSDHLATLNAHHNLDIDAIMKAKRSKLNNDREEFEVPITIPRFSTIHCGPGIYASFLHQGIMATIEKLKPDLLQVGEVTLEGLLAALSIFASIFAKHVGTVYHFNILKQFCGFLPWFHQKGEEGMLSVWQVSIFVEVMERLLFDKDKISEIRHAIELQLPHYLEQVISILLLSWSSFQGNQLEMVWKLKYHVLTIASKVSLGFEDQRINQILELGLKDSDACVRAAAIMTFPVFAAQSTLEHVKRLCEILKDIQEDAAEHVREAVAKIIGPMACIYDAKLLPDQSHDTCVAAKIFHTPFSCHVCAASSANDCQQLEKLDIWSPFSSWFLLVYKLLFEEPSYHVQVALISNISRLLIHSSKKDLMEMRDLWMKCLAVFPLHEKRVVREAFCSQIYCFLKEHVLREIVDLKPNDCNSSAELEVLGKLRYALSVTADPEIRETLMETVAEVAKVANNRQLCFFSIALLIEQLDHEDASLSSHGVKLLNEVALFRWPASGFAVRSMVDSVREELFEYLSARLINRSFMVKEFAEAVMCMEYVDVLKEMAPVVLPKLILEQKHNSKALDTLNEFARLLQTDLPLLLLQCCHKVLSFLLLRADGKELMAAFDFYDAQTGSDSCELFKAALPQLLDELVRFLGDDESEEALRRSARVAPMIQEVASIVTGSDDLPSFLRIHFVGLLNTIDRKLLRNEDLTYQKQALRCIKHLLKMIGPYLNAFVPKLMALLTRAVQELPLQLEALHVWLSFVQQLAQVSPLNVKTVASQIMVALMPCLEAQEAVNATAVAAVLEELVVKNRNLLTNQVRELPLLPSLPSLVNVNAVLHEARGLLNLRDQLQQAVDGLGHESINVRYTTASELRKVMLKNRREIIGMVIGEVTTDTKVISSLVTALLHGCAEESRTSISQKFKMVCAECLGELGAIDPAKLNISLQRSSKIENNDEDFVFELVNEHLAGVLRAATDLDVQDAAALAIQELLKLSGCQEAVLRKTYPDTGCASNCSTSLAEKGQKLWNRFSNDIKEIITPCLTSKYLLKNLNAVASSGPIFRPGMPFRRWIFLWIRWLVSQATGQRSNIFTACRGVVRHDMGTALYLLPSLVLDVVCEGTSEARTCIMEEILAVLADASLDEDSLSKAACMSWHGLGEVSIQTVFTLLDKLGQWLDECKQGPILSQIMQTPPNGKGTRSSRNLSTKDDITYLTQQCEHVAQLLAAIPKPALAGASFRCHAYARSLLYYESYVREKSGALNPAAESNVVFIDEDVAFLLRIYGGLDEPDGLSGLASAHKSTSLQDQFLINEKGGNWAEALTCCEQALQMEPKDLFWQSGVLDCLVNMGHLQAMVTHVDGLIARMPECKREWSMRGIQAAWRLGQWDLLDEYVRGAEGENVLSGVESTASFDHSLAKALQALRLKDQFKFFDQLTHCRLALLAPLTAASMESYTRAYPLIVKLHMLRELEDFFAIGFSEGDRESTSDDDSCLVDMADLVEIWDGRLRITQPLLWTREPILSLRRLVYGSKEMQPEVASCWLQYAKLCRTAGHYETANRAILQAQSAGAPNVELEKAKLYWDTKKTQQAIDELQQVLANVSQNTLGNATGAALSGLLHNPTQAISVTRQTQQKQDDPHAAKALLLLARWVHHTGQKQKEDVINMFSRVKELQPKWEKSYFFMARYFDDLLGDARRRQEENEAVRGTTSVQKRNNNMQIADDKAWWIYLPETILFYAKGLHKGHRHMFQALPRLLTLWFEFGTICESQGSNKALKAVHARVMSIMRGCLKDLPSYQWLTALPQLVSRICHRNEEIIRLVKHIITTILQAYPQQALWTMAAVSKSTVVERREAAAEIIQAARNAVQKEEEKLLFNQFANLIEQMIRLCFCTGKDKARSLNISSEFGLLKRMMPVGVIMPVQRALTVSLPANGLTNPSYSPFRSGDHSTISGIKDEVEILASLQRPKKVVLIGSDGREYPFLCKPKDDLRKDARMMEFTSMINRLLSKDPNSRRRKLYIRTFAVIPLTEDCGMVEWVLHTRGFRHILQDLYVACGKFDRQKTNPMIKKIYDEHQNKLSSGELMRSKLLPMFPPIFHKWFLNMFPEPTSWFQARVAFAHTTAVWSMVGHIVGLGDRHGENILFDSTTGDCVHVDFSCLFDKGLQLERPELVPFRLTQNMIDGLGITGYEGTFLRVCEITLSILRAHRETLMSVLETFIHDPLVEWTKSHRSSGTEVRNPHAQRALANIQARLQGVVVGVGAAPSLPLSVEGQAHRLIAEAVSLDNLGRMYIWWMPWL